MKLVYGRAGSGKSYFCMNEIKKNIENETNNTLIYIVPEQYSLGAEFRLTDVLKRSGTINVQVLSFKRLAYRVFNELGFTKTTFSKASMSMLIYYIMLENEKKLNLLKGVNKNKGLVDTVLDIISEFKRYNISYESINNIQIDNEYLKMKLQDISFIYKKFEEKISNEYVDIDSRLTVLSKLISKSSFLKNAIIWIDEFDGFTPQELEIIKELNKVANLTITLTYDENQCKDLFFISKKTYDKIKSFSNLEEICLNNPKKFSNNELYHLEQNIFKYPYVKYDKLTTNIHINIEADPYKEIENVARIIYKNVKEKGLRYENFAIITRDIDSHKTIIKRVFNNYNIPYFFDDKKELSMQPLFTLIISLFDIIIKNFKYESIFNYLKTGFTNIKDQNDIDLIENYVLQYGIKGISTWQKEWTYPHDDLEKINLIRANIIEPIIDFKNSVYGKKTVKELATYLYNFLIKIKIYENINSKVDEILKQNNSISNELEICNTYIQVWNILMNIIDEIVSCLGNETMNFDTFKNIFIQGISEHQIGIIPTSNDQVMIGDISRTRNSNVKTLFIIGVNDGIFPMTFSTEGFINDSERDLLLEKGVELAKNTKLSLMEENFNIYQTLTLPTDELYISYPITNSDGSALRPSVIINQIKNIFPDITTNNNVLNIHNEITTPKDSFNTLLTNIKNYYNGKKIESKWENAYLWYIKNEPEKLIKVQSGLDYKNTIEYLNKNHSQKLYGNELYGSVSSLETFANCPFSFFLKYGLRIKDRKIFKLETPDVGLFLHDIIDSFSKYYIDRNISLRDVSKDEADKVVSELVDEALNDYKYNIFSSSNQMKVLSNRLKRLVKRMVWIIINHIKSGEFEIVGTEVGFGNDKQFSAVEIELSDGKKLLLTGTIDRIDIAKTEDGKFIRIIDYKSYNKELKLSDIYYGLQLQLLVYMDASISNSEELDSISESELLPGGMLYLKLDNPIIKSKKNISIDEIEADISKKLRMKGVILSDARLLKAMDANMNKESSVLDLSIKKDGTYTTKVPLASKKQFDDLIYYTKKVLKEMGDEIVKGKINIEPAKKKNQTPCEYCDYKLICRFDKELGNKFKIINELKDEEVFHKISQ